MKHLSAGNLSYSFILLSRKDSYIIVIKILLIHLKDFLCSKNEEH